MGDSCDGLAAPRRLCRDGHAVVIAVNEQAPSASPVGENAANAVPLWRARDMILTELRALEELAAQGHMKDRELLRLEAKVIGFGVEESMLWLRSQSMLPRVFFLNPDSSLLSAGCGEAHRVSGNGDLQDALVKAGTPPAFRYFGGSRFDSGAQVGKEWADFGGHFFVLPQLELVYTSEQCVQQHGDSEWEQRSTGDNKRGNLQNRIFTFAVNIKAGSDGGWSAALARATHAVEGMCVTLGMERELPTPTSMGNGTSYEDWKSSVERALAELGKGGELRKVVLSRNFFVQF